MNDDVFSLIQAWPCCSLASVQVTDLPKRERQFFDDFMPNVATAVVLLHHVVTEQEWMWYATGDSGERCDADDHLRHVCVAVRNELANWGHAAQLVKYPGESGLQFRFVAEAAGLGRIGTNAFLFHPEWGPWVHLRIMGTTAELDLRPELSGVEFCDECGLCISECPAEAISENSFDGLRCRLYRQARGEYEPHGSAGLLPYCKRCVWICPKGEQPVAHRGEGGIVEPGTAPDVGTAA